MLRQARDSAVDRAQWSGMHCEGNLALITAVNGTLQLWDLEEMTLRDMRQVFVPKTVDKTCFLDARIHRERAVVAVRDNGLIVLRLGEDWDVLRRITEPVGGLLIVLCRSCVVVWSAVNCCSVLCVLCSVLCALCSVF